MLTDPRLIVGLDQPLLDAAPAMVDRLGATMSAYKIGLSFRLAHGDPETLASTDRLRLTDRATRDIRYWRVADAVRTERGRRGV